MHPKYYWTNRAGNDFPYLRMTKQKNEKEKKKARSNQRLFKTKMKGNTLPQNGIEVGKERKGLPVQEM